MITGLDVNSGKLICSECGSIILNHYNRYDKMDKILCSNCSKKAKKCDVCGVPSALLDELDGLKVCPSCMSKKDRCDCTGEELNKDNRKVIKGIPAFFSKDALKKSKYKCDKCGRPVKNKSELIKLSSNNKLICELCNNIYIYNPDIAYNILINISRLLNIKFDINIPKDLPLYLVNEIELKYLRKMKNKSQLINSGKNGISAYDGKLASIYILEGLPIDKFISALTSEYIMCVLSSKIKLGGYNSVEKGFSQWVTCKLLYLLGYQKERKEVIMQDSMENGRGGLIKIMNIEKYRGNSGVLDFVFSKNKKYTSA
ncbi:MAG: zinc ribbon domain-containing protein [Spirochaetota bacterium]